MNNTNTAENNMIYIISSDYIDASGSRYSTTAALKEGSGASYGILIFKDGKVIRSTSTYEVCMGSFIVASGKLLENSIPQSFPLVNMANAL